MVQLRILHCLRAPVGGLFRHVRDLAEEQVRSGHAVGIVCDASASDPLTSVHLGRLEPSLELGLSRVVMPREIGRGDIGALRAVKQLAAAMQVDVLHGHGAKGGAYARLAAASLRRRGLAATAFYTPHGGSLHYDPRSLKGRVFMTAERQLSRMTDGILFESAYAARVFAAHVGEPACAARVVHNGIRSDELEPVRPNPDAADFVYVGELRLLKGVDLLIEAVTRIAADRLCRLTIVGAGPDAARFHSEVAARGLDPQIVFAGAMPARDAFRLGRVVVMPSRAESLPYVALEAAGAGLPLIATNVGGVGEIVYGTDTPLVPPNDAIALASAMREALVAPDVAWARAQRLRHAVTRRFSVATMAQNILAFYGETADRRLPSAGADVPHPANQPI